MPRPGPRPYECVRRAWHSERHQPIRGSIIQQIFRVVNDTHSSATKKNKEWQEKLPIVVFRAEEIMYSKANSEEDYLNLDTLWDRLIDAINTIIRRDESTETGELLPPCVEAALNLGCIPVRASRSQRHSNPRTYLSPRAQEPAPGTPKTIGESCSRLMPLQSSNSFTKTSAAISALPGQDSNKHSNHDGNFLGHCNYPFALENLPAGDNQSLTMESKTPLNLGSVYPLYYETELYTNKSKIGTPAAANACSNTVFVGTPVVTPLLEPAKIGILQNIFSSGTAEHFADRPPKGTTMDMQEKSRERGCDLSLRLGLYSSPCMSGNKISPCATDNGVSSSSQEGGKYSNMSSQMDDGFCFYPERTAYDSFDSNSSKWNSEGDDHNRKANFRKRKAHFGSNEGDGQFCRQRDIPSNYFNCQTKGPGL